MTKKRHHRPKPRRLKRGEQHQRVAYHNRLTGWYRVGPLVFHGTTPIADVIYEAMVRGMDLRFSIERKPSP